MKKIILLFYLYIYIVACVPSSDKNSTDNETIQIKIEPYLKEIFIDKYPNYKSNTLVKEKAISELTCKIDSLLPYKYLEEIPLDIFRIRKNPYGKGAIVQFYADNYDNKNKDVLSNQLAYEIIGLMSEEIASSLDDKSKYLIFGKKYNRLDKTKISLIVPQSYHSAESDISEDAIWDGVYNFNVGVFICEIDSVRKIIK